YSGPCSGPTRVRSRCTAHDYKQPQAAHYHPKPYASWGTDPDGRKTGIGPSGDWRTHVRPGAKKSIRILMGKPRRGGSRRLRLCVASWDWPCSGSQDDAIVAALELQAGKTTRIGGVSMSKALLTLSMPSPPDPVPVGIDPATTALLVFDILEHICPRPPQCREQLVPAIASLLERARQAGVAIAYGTRAANMSTWLPEVAPAPGDIKIESHAQDRFYNTDLDKALKAMGITTLVLTGWKISG